MSLGKSDSINGQIPNENNQVKQRAMELLKDSNLINRLVKAVQDNKNIVGEKLPIETIIVICGGSKVKNRATTSTNMALDTPSGAGKDYVIDGVRFTLFKNKWQKYSTPTPTAIMYGQIKYKKKKEDGSGYIEVSERESITSDTILYIKDASQDWLDHDDNKLLMEDDEIRLSKKIPKGYIKDINFPKPIIFISTAETSVKNQIIRRLPNLKLDETDEQTIKIIKMQQDEDAFKTIGQINEDIEIADIAVNMLKKWEVSLADVIDYIDEKRPKSKKLQMRTLNKRMQDYIKFYTALYQYQRKKDENGRIIANNNDVDMGIKLFKHVYMGEDNKIRNLNSRQRKIYKTLKMNIGKRYKVAEIYNWKWIYISKTVLYEDMKRIAIETDVESDGYPLVYYYPKPPLEIEVEIEED